MEYGSVKEKKVHPALIRERDSLDFDQAEFTTYLAGGAEREAWIHQCLEIIEKNPVLQNKPEWYGWGREEKIEDIYKKIRTVADMWKDLPFKMNGERLNDTLFMYTQGQVPLVLHYYMFKGMVYNLATDEQRNRWMHDINHLRIHGAYCQTELGHGTNIQGLETTATLDKSTDEIILHTPNIRATKFWPGELGLHANMPIVVARLIVDGKD